MKRFPLFLVATTLLVTVSASAQRGSRSERNVRGGVAASRHVGNHNVSPASRSVAQRAATSRQAAITSRQAVRAGSRVVSNNAELRRGSRSSARTSERSERSQRWAAPGVRLETTSRGVERGRSHGYRNGRGVIGFERGRIERGVRGRGYGHQRVFRRGFGWGYWQVRTERVLVEAGHWHRQHVPAVYGWLYDSCGNRYWGIVTPACWERVWCPPRYENRSCRVWVRC